MKGMLDSPAPLPADVTRGARAEVPAIALSVLGHLGLVLGLCLVLPRTVPAPGSPPAIAVVFVPALSPVFSAAHVVAEAVLQSRARQIAIGAPLAESLPPLEVLAKVYRPKRTRMSFDRGTGLRASADLHADSAGATAEASAQRATPPLTAVHVPSVGDAGSALMHLEARIREAVQEAVLYPPAARLLRRQGKTQVQFDYDDGHVSGIAVAASSPFPALDAAALGAVRRAAVPRAPAEIGDRRLTMLVWVNFSLVAQD